MAKDIKKLKESLNGLSVNGKGFDELQNEIAQVSNGSMTENQIVTETVARLLESQLDFGKHKDEADVRKTAMSMLSDIWQDGSAVTSIEQAQDYLNDWLDGYEFMHQ